MFSINIYTNDATLLEYLSYEGTKQTDTMFGFSSPGRFAEVLSRYSYHSLKRETLLRLITDSESQETEMESFMMFVPDTYEEMWMRRIGEMLLLYIENDVNGELYMDGFMTFRMNDIRKKYYTFLEEEYHLFLEATEPTDSLEAMVQFMESQPIRAEEIVIKTMSNGQVHIQQDNKDIYIEKEGEQENLVVQCIFAVPRRVVVVDEFKILRKELVIVLRQIFGKNLNIIKREQKMDI